MELSISISIMTGITVSLPLTGFAFCLLWSVFVDFEAATFTHCEVDQIAPSISSVIGGFTPQKQVWNTCIGISSTPRILLAVLYFRYFQERLAVGRRTSKLVTFNFVLNVIENLSLLGLSFVSSSEIFVLHKIFFFTFMVTSMMSMVLTMGFLYRKCGFQPRTQQERRSLSYKTQLVKVIFSGAALMVYFYWRHNEYCEPYVYSLFAMCEYTIVLCNMAYHGMGYYDFHDKYVRVVTDSIIPR